MITISKIHLSKIKQHGIETFPNECCGAMMGYLDSKKKIRVTQELIRLENTTNENKNRRFSITPEDYKSLEEYSKKSGMSILGFYHSHPNHPAVPSTTDLDYAWPNFSYIIVSINDWMYKEIKSFELDLDTEEFKEEELRIGF